MGSLKVMLIVYYSTLYKNDIKAQINKRECDMADKQCCQACFSVASSDL